MKPFIIALVLLVTGSVGYASEMTIKVREVTEETKSEEVKTDTKYFADIYIDGNKLADGIELKNQEEAKVVCETYMKDYNLSNNKKLPVTAKTISAKVAK